MRSRSVQQEMQGRVTKHRLTVPEFFFLEVDGWFGFFFRFRFVFEPVFLSFCSCVVTVALCNRADRYILPCNFYLLSSFFPRLISAAADWMSTILLHMAWP